MAFPNKTNTPIAVDSRTSIPLNPQHITTSNFFELNVAYAMEMVPDNSLKVEHSLFTRLEPMAVPTFGRARIQNRAFFVPFRTVWNAWNDFIDDTPNVAQGNVFIPTTAPIIHNDVFVSFFQKDDISTSVDADVTADFEFGGDRWVLTPFGRWCLKIFYSLGYRPVMSQPYNASYSCLPLFCLARIFVDWYYPAQYASSSDYLFITSLLTKTFVAPNNLSLVGISNADDLLRIMKCMYNVAYDSDYFTSAWDNPNTPNNGLSSDVSILSLNNSKYNSNDDYAVSINKTTSATGSSDPFIESFVSDNSSIAFSEQDLTTLKALTDYCKRNQIAGSRALDRYLSRFGVRLASEKLNRCILIESYSQPIQFGDVTSTASTDTAALGDFAGKGLSYGSGKYVVDSNGEYGFFIVLSNIIPDVAYYQGLNRHVKHITRFDFWTPEFDGVATQAIGSDEVFLPLVKPSGWSTMSGYMQSVWGFTGMYGEYKVAHSLLTGDYSLNSRNVGKDSWNLYRNVESMFPLENSVHHDIDFVLTGDKGQYNRIFNDTTDRADKFNIIHDFNILSSFPGKSLFDTYEFENEDKAKKVTVDIGGTTLN